MRARALPLAFSVQETFDITGFKVFIFLLLLFFLSFNFSFLSRRQFIVRFICLFDYFVHDFTFLKFHFTKGNFLDSLTSTSESPYILSRHFQFNVANVNAAEALLDD